MPKKSLIEFKKNGENKKQTWKIIQIEKNNDTCKNDIGFDKKKIDHLNWILFFDYEIQHDRKTSQNNTLEQKMYFKFFCCFYTVPSI